MRMPDLEDGMSSAPWSLLCLLTLIQAGPDLAAQDFTRITEGPMVNDDRYSEGSSWGDINNDSYLDLFIPHAYSDRSNLLFVNNGDGTFSQVTTGPVVTDMSTSSGCSFGDFDNDGDLDIFVQNWNGMSSHLYLNQGTGTFTKVTSGQIVSDGGWSFNSSVVDYDNDGNLDIYVDNGTFTSFVEDNFLYHGNGDGTFEKVTTGVLVNDEEHCLSSSWCDYDNDGDQDLYTANSDPFNGIAICDFLYRNDGGGNFTRLTAGPVVSDTSISIGGSWGDYDNDGDFDLFVANWYGEDNHLYTNQGDGTFISVTAGQIVSDGGNSVSGAWGDYDNDGDLDLYVTNDWNENNYLYRNNGDGSFTRILSGDIVSDGGRSNGATWVDYDNDGWIDMYVPNGQNPAQSNFLYRNNGVSGNHWADIRCVGGPSNASAIGTRVRARAVIGAEAVWQVREVSGHQGFNAQESFNVEFGLGGATSIDSLVFQWPSGTVDIYTDVDADLFYEAVEGEGLSIVQTSVEEDPGIAPPELGISGILPNPFSSSCSIQWQLDRPSRVLLRLYDLSGKLVVEVSDAEYGAGPHSSEFNASGLSSGVYLVSLSAGGETVTGKCVVVR
jgi:hypothetical protein